MAVAIADPFVDGLRALDHVEDNPVRILDIKPSGRVRANWHQRASVGLKPRESCRAILHTEGRYHSIVTRRGITKEVELV